MAFRGDVTYGHFCPGGQPGACLLAQRSGLLGGCQMPNRLEIHSLVSGKYLEREESWSLSVDENGDYEVVLEWFEVEPFSKAPPKEGRDCLSVDSALARGDEVSRKLRDAFGSAVSQWNRFAF